MKGRQETSVTIWGISCHRSRSSSQEQYYAAPCPSYHHNTIIPHSPYPLHALVDVSSRTLFSFSVHPVLSSWQCVANLQFSWDVNSVLDAFFRDLEQDRGQNKGRIWCTNLRHQAPEEQCLDGHIYWATDL